MFSVKKFALAIASKQHCLKTELEKLYRGVLEQRSVLNALSSVRYKSRQDKDDENLNLVRLASQAHMVPYESENTVPIIIMHGLLGSKNNWSSMAKAIMRGTNNRLVFTLDARNHGDSNHTEAFSYELMAADLIKFLYDHNIKRASFIGHSMGGRVCMMLAQLNPEVVRDLVVVDISPVGQSPKMLELPVIFEAIKELELDPNLVVTDARRQAFVQLEEKLKDQKLIQFLLTNLVESGSSWRWKFNIESISMNFKSKICKFPKMTEICDQPTLFIAGGESDYIRPGEEAAIQQIFPSSKFVYISGAGHWVHSEKPKEFLATLLPFLIQNALDDD